MVVVVVVTLTLVQDSTMGTKTDAFLMESVCFTVIVFRLIRKHLVV